MKPISNDKRQSIIEAKKRNESVKDIMDWFKVGSATINRIWRKYKETGSIEPIPYTGRKSTFTEEMDKKIIAMVTEKPDITQQELIDELSLDLTQSGLARHMKKLGLTLKKDNLSYREKTRRCYRKKGTMAEKSGRARY